VTTATEASLTRATVEDFLYREAELLDSGELAAWLELFTDDAVYWVPAGRDDGDPHEHVSLIYDDRHRIGERVWRLTEGPAHAQIPPSLTSRQIGNVRVVGIRDGATVVRSRFTLVEVRKGQQRVFAGSYEHHLVPSGDDLRIARRIVRLVNADAPIFNLTFIV
jgi:3-phenylpropionate/cinnamic acid dioxygenase small subunit